MRNVPGWLRTKYSSFFAWFGKISLEVSIEEIYRVYHRVHDCKILPKGVSDLTILQLSRCLTLFLAPFYCVNVSLF
jgi:hypothetical protein